MRGDFEQTECIAACHTTSRRCNPCSVTAARQELAYTVVHVALVVFVNLLSFCAECRSHLAVAHMVLGTLAVCVCVCVCLRGLSKHMTFTHGLVYCVSAGLLGSLRNHMERLCTAADPRVMARPGSRGVSRYCFITLCVHTTLQRAPRTRGLARKNDITASARLGFAQ